jgi:Na+/alanine symporter
MYSQTLKFLEDGRGTALHAAAEVSHPVKQGLVQSFLVYVTHFSFEQQLP